MSIKDPIAASMASLLLQADNISLSITETLDAIKESNAKPEVKLSNVESVKNRFNTLEELINKLDLLNTSIDLASKALLAQELAITANPISAAAYEVAKKAFTIMTYKTTLESLGEALKNSVEVNKKNFQELSDKIQAEESSLKQTLNQ